MPGAGGPSGCPGEGRWRRGAREGGEGRGLRGGCEAEGPVARWGSAGEGVLGGAGLCGSLYEPEVSAELRFPPLRRQACWGGKRFPVQSEEGFSLREASRDGGSSAWKERWSPTGLPPAPPSEAWRWRWLGSRWRDRLCGRSRSWGARWQRLPRMWRVCEGCRGDWAGTWKRRQLKATEVAGKRPELKTAGGLDRRACPTFSFPWVFPYSQDWRWK